MKTACQQGLAVRVPRELYPKPPPPSSFPTLNPGPGLPPASPITINEHNLDHGDDEEGQGIHLHLHQGGSDEEHQQDSQQAAQDPNGLRDPRRGRGMAVGVRKGQSGAEEAEADWTYVMERLTSDAEKS